MKQCWTILCLLAGATVLGSTLAGEWAQFRGPGGQGVSPEKGVPVGWGQEENLLWKTELPGAGASSPVVVGERIFLTAYTGYNVPGQPRGSQEDLQRHLLCLDRATGKILWNRPLAARLPEQASIREGHGYATSTPVADRDRVHVFLGKSGVVTFDHSGRQLWQADVGSRLNGWGSAASLALAGELLLVNASVESESLVALDRKTGKEVWRAPRIRESWNTPVLLTLPGGKQELILAIQGKVLGLDLSSGKTLWSCATDIPWYMVPSLVVHGDVVYCVGGRNPGGALAVRAGGRGDVTETHRLWTSNKGSNVPTPIFHDGHLYYPHDNLGMMYCLDAATGRTVREVRVRGAGQFYASPVLAGGHLYCTDRSGRTFVFTASPKLEQVAVNDLRDRSAFNASPAIDDGRLLIRSDRYLYCIGTR